MKLKDILFILFTGLCLISCQNGMDEPEADVEINQPELTGVKYDILVNILTSQTGRYVEGNNPLTRGGLDLSITPYVEDGDTLLYIVQYRDGWEIYSANRSTNMVLFSSNHGILDIDDESMPDALKSLIKGNIESIKDMEKSAVGYVHPSWGHAALTEEDFKKGKVTVIQRTRNEGRRVIDYSDTPPGEWILIYSEVLEENTQCSDKLIQTLWYQSSPWNKYSKKFQDNGQLVSAPAGCATIAISQYLYYTHSKDNIPQNTASTAVQTADGLDYTFSGTTTSFWDSMPLEFEFFANYDKVAIFIGDIGHKLKADYEIDKTSVYNSDSQRLLEDTYNLSFPIVDFSYSYVKNSISQGYPVVAYAESDQSGDDNKAYGDNSHLFLIDQFKETKRKVKYTYGLKRDPLPYGMVDPWESDIVDDEGNFIDWAYKNEIISEYTVDKGVSMNWG